MLQTQFTLPTNHCTRKGSADTLGFRRMEVDVDMCAGTVLYTLGPTGCRNDALFEKMQL